MAVHADEEREFLNQESESDGELDQSARAEEINRSVGSVETPISEEGEIIESDRDRQDQNTESRSKTDQTGQRNDNLLQKEDGTAADKIKQIDNEMLQKITELHNLMSGGGLNESAAMLNRCADVLLSRSGMNSNDNCKRKNECKEVIRRDKSRDKDYLHSKSVETIYENAIPKRGSSSSEEDFLLEANGDDRGFDRQVEFLISESRCKVLQTEMATTKAHNVEVGAIESGLPGEVPSSPQPTTSAGRGQRQHDRELLEPPTFISPEEKVQTMIRQAEASKAKIFNTPGKQNEVNFLTLTAMVDEGYFVVGAHLDETNMNKIGRGEYVDFGKLLPWDKVLNEEDYKLEMIV